MRRFIIFAAALILLTRLALADNNGIELKYVGSCRNMSVTIASQISELLRDRLKTTHAKVNVGKIDDLYALLKEAGLEEKDITSTLKKIQTIMETKENDSVIAPTISYLKKVIGQADKLFICSAGIGCRLSDTIAYNLHTRPAVIVFTRNRDWVLDFFYDATRQATLQIVSDWIDANRILRKSRKPTDPLFDQYVEQSNDQFIIDAEFLEKLVENNAINVTYKIANTLFASNHSIRSFHKYYFNSIFVEPANNMGGMDQYSRARAIIGVIRETIGRIRGFKRSLLDSLMDPKINTTSDEEADAIGYITGIPVSSIPNSLMPYLRLEVREWLNFSFQQKIVSIQGETVKVPTMSSPKIRNRLIIKAFQSGKDIFQECKAFSNVYIHSFISGQGQYDREYRDAILSHIFRGHYFGPNPEKKYIDAAIQWIQQQYSGIEYLGSDIALIVRMSPSMVNSYFPTQGKRYLTNADKNKFF